MPAEVKSCILSCIKSCTNRGKMLSMLGQELPFGQRIKQQRRQLDLTQEELAERVGCSVDTIRKLEAGSVRPSRHLAEILAARLDIPASECSAFISLARTAP